MQQNWLFTGLENVKCFGKQYGVDKIFETILVCDFISILRIGATFYENWDIFD